MWMPLTTGQISSNCNRLICSHFHCKCRCLKLNPAHLKHPIGSDPGFLEACSCLDYVKIWTSPLKHSCSLSHLDRSAAPLKWPGQLPCENYLAQNRTKCIILAVPVFFHLRVKTYGQFYVMAKLCSKDATAGTQNKNFFVFCWSCCSARIV